MSVVVGIDPSITATGIAIVKPPHLASNPNIPRVLTAKSPECEAGLAHHAERVESQAIRIVQKIGNEQVRLVVIEDLPGGMPAWGAMTERCALWWLLVRILSKRRIPVAVVNPNVLKLWATGHGKADKDVVHAAMCEMWPGAELFTATGKRDDNRADALALASMGTQALGWADPELTHHYSPKVNWPKGITNAH